MARPPADRMGGDGILGGRESVLQEISAPVPGNEEERLQALDRYAIVDTSPEPAFDRITRLASHIFGAPIALISLIDRARQWFKSRHGLDVAETSRGVAFCAHAILTDGVMVVPDAGSDSRFANNPLVTGGPRIRFYAGAPLHTSDGYNLGTLCVIDRAPRAMTEREQQLLADLAALVMDEIELRQVGRVAKAEIARRIEIEKELTRLAATDSLTEAFNRRAFMQRAEQEVRRAARYRHQLSVLMLDIDRFKRINDTYGHAAGDAALRELVSFCRVCLRTEDVLGRIGGEEFAVLLPETGIERAGEVAERLRQGVEGLRVRSNGHDFGFTLSVGATVCAPAGESFEAALRRADAALYRAKQRGRNRVVVAPGAGAEAGAGRPPERR